ncbi:MAG TPA: hypothetical protein VM639_07920 [Dongiaceae bacterium]|nr:hypothetical protein [Dongiaceae bacterium]
MFGFKSVSVAAIAAISMLYGTPARAASILTDQGSITYDPDTKLQWLDITATAGLSYNDVLTNNGVNFVQNGWRFATDFEVDQLYRHAGLPLASYPNGQFFYASDPMEPGYAALEHDAFTLGSQLGWTSQAGNDFSTNAFFDIHQTPRNPAILGFTTLSIIDYLENGPDSSFIVDEALDSITKNDRIATAGAMLVRDVSVVPIPGGVIPFAAILLGLTSINLWRKREQDAARA